MSHFLRLPPVIRIKIYRHLLTGKSILPQDPKYMGSLHSIDILDVSRQIRREASMILSLEGSFLVQVRMNDILFLRNQSTEAAEAIFPDRYSYLYRTIQNVVIWIDWKYNPLLCRFGSGPPIQTVANKMRGNITAVCDDLRMFPSLECVHVTCSGTNEFRGSLPGPLITRGFLRLVEALQRRKPHAYIIVEDIHELAGPRYQVVEEEYKSLRDAIRHPLPQVG